MSNIKEEIRGIAGYADGYGVDNEGNVYTFKQGRRRKLNQHDHKGYQRVFLFTDNVRKSHFVHRLVAQAFVKPVKGKEWVNHKDGNKRNNNAENLEWCTREENQRHNREVLGNTNLGNRNGNHGYRKSRFYPSENLRSRLIELGVPRADHDIVTLGEILPAQVKHNGNFFGLDCSRLHNGRWIINYSNSRLKEYVEMVYEKTEAEARAKMLIYLLENNLMKINNQTKI